MAERTLKGTQGLDREATLQRGVHVSIHIDPVQMIRECLSEYIEISRLGLNHKKDHAGSVLGYATAEMLFRIVDVIGGYCRDEMVEVRDSTRRRVGTDSQGFFILNHPYFGYMFTRDEVKRVCSQVRNPLTHGAILGVGVRLSKERSVQGGIVFGEDQWLEISLPELFERVEGAVSQFLSNGEKHLASSRVAERDYLVVNAAGIEAIRQSSEGHEFAQSVSVTARGPDPTFLPRRKRRGSIRL